MLKIYVSFEVAFYGVLMRAKLKIAEIRRFQPLLQSTKGGTMLHAIELKPDIYWVGGVVCNELKFHG